MVYGIPKCTHTCSKKSLAMAFVVIFFLQDVRMDIIENRSITKKTHSFIFLVEGSLDMYSIEMCSHGMSEVGIGVYMPFFLVVGLEMMQAMHDLIYLLMSWCSFDQ